MPHRQQQAVDRREGLQGDRQGKQDTAYKPQDTWQTAGQTVDVFCLCAMLRTLMTVKIYRKDSGGNDGEAGRGGGRHLAARDVISSGRQNAFVIKQRNAPKSSPRGAMSNGNEEIGKGKGEGEHQSVAS